MIKRLFRNIFIIAICITVTIVAYNYAFDFFGVLRRTPSNLFFTPNSIYVKLSHVIRNKNKYDSFLFGSSRAGTIDVRHILNGKYYNMFFFCGIPQEWLKSVQLMLENRICIKHIVIALDEFSFKVFPEARRNEPHFRLFPTTPEEKVCFYLSYLFERPSLADLMKRTSEITSSGIRYDFGDTGNFFMQQKEKTIEMDPEKHRTDDAFNSLFENTPNNRMKPLLDELNHILRICKENHITVTVFMNPSHIHSYLKQDIRQLNRFKVKLAHITDFYDFCMLSPLIADNYNFYDSFHFRPHVGDIILSKIFHYPNVSVPDGFGIQVTKQNVKKYTDMLAEQYKYYQQTKRIRILRQEDLI